MAVLTRRNMAEFDDYLMEVIAEFLRGSSGRKLASFAKKTRFYRRYADSSYSKDNDPLANGIVNMLKLWEKRSEFTYEMKDEWIEELSDGILRARDVDFESAFGDAYALVKVT